jgi:hypothetical protein
VTRAYLPLPAARKPRTLGQFNIPYGIEPTNHDDEIDAIEARKLAEDGTVCEQLDRDMAMVSLPHQSQINHRPGKREGSAQRVWPNLDWCHS